MMVDSNCPSSFSHMCCYFILTLKIPLASPSKLLTLSPPCLLASTVLCVWKSFSSNSPPEHERSGSSSPALVPSSRTLVSPHTQIPRSMMPGGPKVLPIAIGAQEPALWVGRGPWHGPLPGLTLKLLVFPSKWLRLNPLAYVQVQWYCL